MIVATAGHVDHGKTALIKQLTGVETDRLAEEQRRGLSINLGYAYLPTPHGVPLGFIDVPGHRRFINTMIAGVSGIDMGMLLVAADDGVMPQTVEHLEVLELLGVPRLLIVISKTDRVESSRVTALQTELQSWLSEHNWPDMHIFATSAMTGCGIEELKSYLLSESQQLAARDSQGYFRISIDRAFKLKGAGQIVTGTASAGCISVDDTVTHLPSGTALRVRGLRVHDQQAHTANAGSRVALNVSGKIEPSSSLAPGDWLVETPLATSSPRIDVEFTLLERAPFSLKHMAPVKLHIGATRVAGRLALLNHHSNRLLAGERALAQLVLDYPIHTVWGERFLLRDHAEDFTLGGGRVLDAQATRTGKSKAQRIERLNALRARSAGEALEQLVATENVVDLNQFALLCNLGDEDIAALIPRQACSFTSNKKQWCVAQSLWDRGGECLNTIIQRWHAQHPERAGIRLTELRAALFGEVQQDLATSILVSHIQSGALKLDEGVVSRAGFKAKVASAELADRRKIEQYLMKMGQAVPLVSEMSDAIGLSRNAIASALKPALKAGEIFKLTDNRYALPGQMQLFSKQLLQADKAGEPLTVAVIKTYFGAGRKLTIEILEYFDSIRFTRRLGDAREILDIGLPERGFKR